MLLLVVSFLSKLVALFKEWKNRRTRAKIDTTSIITEEMKEPTGSMPSRISKIRCSHDFKLYMARNRKSQISPLNSP